MSLHRRVRHSAQIIRGNQTPKETLVRSDLDGIPMRIRLKLCAVVQRALNKQAEGSFLSGGFQQFSQNAASSVVLCTQYLGHRPKQKVICIL